MNRSAPHFGMTGLATMGANLARNMAHHAIPVAVHNRTTAKTERFMTEHGTEGPLSGHASIEEWVGALEHPRVAMIMVSAGAAVDAVIDKVAPHLDDGDVVVDGGNSLFSDTQRRGAELAGRGIRFMGVGISGGEQGALEGPSIMAGGPRDAYDEIVGPVLEAIAARVGSTPCAAWLGSDGAGHYVKMVHNGIEYADMQLIAESYDLLRNGAGLEVGEIAQRFNAWEHGKLESFLIESTARVLARTDAATAKPLVDVVLDAAEQKGTGRWTAQDALELGVALPTITEAVFARAISSSKAQRVRSGATLAGPSGAGADERLGDDIEHALYASKIVAYAQGFAQMAAASEKHGWDLELAAVATIWRGGCIIRAPLLGRHLRRVRRRGRPSQPHACRLLLQSSRRGSRAMAAGGRPIGRAGYPRARVLLVAGLLRRAPSRHGTVRPHPGPARPLRRTHLPACGPQGNVPHRLERRRRGAPGGRLSSPVAARAAVVPPGQVLIRSDAVANREQRGDWARATAR